MRIRVLRFLRLLPIALLVGQCEVISTLADDFRIGMEMELGPESFSGLTHYFDFDLLQTKYSSSVTPRLGSEFFEGYLRDTPGALEDLPPALRHQLTEGLQLDSLLKTQSREIKTPVLLGLDGAPLKKESLILNTPKKAPEELSGLVTPGLVTPGKEARPVRFMQGPSGIETPKQWEWEKLNERWNALPLSEKQKAVRWERFTPVKKAKIAIDYVDCDLELKKGLSGREAELFSRLSWKPDGLGGVIEFVHREDLAVRDMNEFFSDVRDLAKMAGPRVERKILDPESISSNSAVSFHYHLSRKGKDLTRLTEKLNQLLLLKRVKLGILNDLKENGYFLYNPDLNEKGVMRQIATDRYEVRAHHEPLKLELAKQLEYAQVSPEEAAKKVEQELRAHLTDEVVNQLLRYRIDLAKPLMPLMNPDQILRYQAKLDEHNRTATIIKKGGASAWAHVSSWLEGDDVLLRSQGMIFVLGEKKWPKSFSQKVAQKIETRPASLAAHWWELVASQEKWPQWAWDSALKILSNGTLDEKVTILRQLKPGDGSVPSQVWKTIAQVLPLLDELETRRIARWLRRAPSWPNEFWSEFSRVLNQQESNWAKGDLFQALSNQKTWPASFWKEVPGWIQGADPDTQGAWAKVISQRDDLPSEVLLTVLRDWANPALEPTRSVWARALRNGKKWSSSTWKVALEELGRSSPKAQSELFSVLLAQERWPPGMWQVVSDRFKLADEQELKGIVLGLRDKARWSPEIIESATKTLLNSNSLFVKKHLVMGLAGQRSAGSVFKRILPDLMKQGHEMSSATVQALSHAKKWSPETWQLVPDFFFSLDSPGDRNRFLELLDERGGPPEAVRIEIESRMRGFRALPVGCLRSVL